MKRFTNKILAITFVLTMLCTTFGGLVVSALEPVTMTNPGFETGDLTGWSSYAGTATAVNTEKASGTYSMHMGSGVKYNSEKWAVEAGATYYFSFKANASMSAANATARIDLYEFNASGTKTSTNNFINPTDGGGWKSYGKTFVPKDDTVEVQVQLMSTSNGVNVYWDDFSLAKLGEEVDMGEAVVNGGMETVTAGAPDGWAFSGTATATIDTTDKKAGANSLKVVNTEGDFVASKSCLIDNRVKRLVSVYFNLTEIGEGANGVKLSVYDLDGTLKAETSYFKAIGKGWRKALVVLPANSTSLEVTIKLTVSGAATVNFDELSSIGSDAIIDNGDLTGMTSDLTPAGWKKFVNISNTGLVDNVESLTVGGSDPYEGFNGFEIISDDTVGTCAKLTNTSKGLSIFWPDAENTEMEKGARYKLTFDYKGNDVLLLHTAELYQPGTTTLTQNTNLGQIPASSEWVRGFEYYFTYDYADSKKTGDWFLNIVGRYPKTATPDYIANISLEKVEDTDKVEITQSGTTVTAEYTGFVADKDIDWTKAILNGETLASATTTFPANNSALTQTKDKSATLLFALYEKIGDVLKLSAVETDSGSPVYVAYPQSGQEVWKAPINEKPVVLTKSFDLGEYENATIAKAFVWDSIDTMLPYMASETLEITR